MKMKYFLRGLGVGVLLATLLLCISYRGQNNENSIIKDTDGKTIAEIGSEKAKNKI